MAVAVTMLGARIAPGVITTATIIVIRFALKATGDDGVIAECLSTQGISIPVLITLPFAALAAPFLAVMIVIMVVFMIVVIVVMLTMLRHTPFPENISNVWGLP